LEWIIVKLKSPYTSINRRQSQRTLISLFIGRILIQSSVSNFANVYYTHFLISLVGGDDVGALVFDIGSQWTRAGFAGEDVPKCHVPSHIGVKKIENSPTSYYIGNQALLYKQDFMDIEATHKDGVIENWDHYERLLQHSFGLMGANPTEHPLMLGEIPLIQKEIREKHLSFLFEKFDVPAVYLAKNSVLACFAHGRTSALVIDSGYSNTSVTPVYEGYALISNAQRSPYGGDALTAILMQHLENQKIDIRPPWSFKKKNGSVVDVPVNNMTKSYTKFSQKTIAEDIKHSIFQVPEMPSDKNPTISTMTYELNTGKIVDIGGERFWMPEMLFKQDRGISSTASDVLTKCDADIRKDLYTNIILTGGNTLLQGFAKRFERDMLVKNYKIKGVLTQPNFPNSKETNWIGGSILASCGAFQQMWISKQEYQENGAQIVHKKCP
jgi:actin-like protein 6A